MVILRHKAVYFAIIVIQATIVVATMIIVISNNIISY